MPATASVPRRSSYSSGITVLAFGNLLPALASVASGPILAQALDVEGRGYVAAALAPFSLLTSLLTFGVPEATTYSVARDPHLARRIAGRSGLLLGLSGLLATATVLLSAGFLSGGVDAIRSLMLIAACALVPSLMVGALRGVAAGLGRWRYIALEKALSSVVKLAVLIPLWLSGNLTPLAATIVLAALPLLGGIPYLVVLARQPAIARSSDVTTPGLLRYGIKVWAGSLAGILLMRLDQSLITPLSDASQAGLYAVAVAIGEIPLMVSAAVRDVAFVSEASESNDDRLMKSARISTFLCGGIALVIGLTMYWWLPTLFGSDFAASVPVAAILLGAVVLGVPGSLAGSGLGGRGRPGLRSWSLIVACGVNILAIALLIPPFGAVGAAVGTLVGNLVAAGMNLFFVRRVLGLRVSGFLGLRRQDLLLVGRSIRSVVVRRRK
ncbi:oligosaccharide flippase family protein [Promicromonospora soli]